MTAVTLVLVIPGAHDADTTTMDKEISRSAERNLCADLIKIVWTDDSGKKRKELAVLEDISSDGACLQVEHTIPVDTPISLLYPQGRYYGRVRHCSFQHTGYFLGVEFDPGYKWSKEDYVPSHLLELNAPRSRSKK